MYNMYSKRGRSFLVLQLVTIVLRDFMSEVSLIFLFIFNPPSFYLQQIPVHSSTTVFNTRFCAHRSAGLIYQGGATLDKRVRVYPVLVLPDSLHSNTNAPLNRNIRESVCGRAMFNNHLLWIQDRCVFTLLFAHI